MFPARFDYRAPASIDEALSALSDGGEEARPLAGGQSLIPMMKLRFAAPSMLVDLQHVPGLDGIGEADGHLSVGAMATTKALEQSALIKDRYPTMAAAAPQISDPLVRNRGTLGGSLAHADPSGDWGSVMLALGAEVVLKSASGERTMPVEEFLVDTFTTAIEPGEILTEIRIPKPGSKTGGSYTKMERKVGDFATVGTAAVLELEDDGSTIAKAGIALTAVGSKNLKATEAEQALVGAEASDEAFAETARLAAQIADPATDARGSAEYKREAARVFVERDLALARDQAQAS